MELKRKSLLEIHFAVLLFGLSGLFAKLVSLPALMIVLGRVIFSSLFLICLIKYRKKEIRLKKKMDYVNLVIMGIILAFHWGTFFKSIQMSTVAIGLLTYSTFPFFVTFLEPYFFREKLKISSVIAALAAFAGIAMVVPKFQIGNSTTQGVMWGVLSGLSFAILSLFNRKYVKEYPSLIIGFYEQFTAAILLFPLWLYQKPVFNLKDLVLLVILGIVFTGISHTLFINGLINVTAHTSGIISTLEPVYGIVFAAVLLKEIPTIREVFGGIIILGSVFYSTIKAKKSVN